jgi:hypothetical protein
MQDEAARLSAAVAVFRLDQASAPAAVAAPVPTRARTPVRAPARAALPARTARPAAAAASDWEEF